MWNCYKFLKCSLLKWEYSVSKAHIHAATKEKKQWSSNFLYMNFTKNLALWNNPQISLQLRSAFNWKDLQNHPNILRPPLGLFILSLQGIFIQADVLEIQYNKLLKILQTKWLSFLQNMNIHLVSSHTAHDPAGNSRVSVQYELPKETPDRYRKSGNYTNWFSPHNHKAALHYRNTDKMPPKMPRNYKS